MFRLAKLCEIGFSSVAGYAGNVLGTIESQLRRPYPFRASTGVLTSQTRLQRRHTKTWKTACSSLMRVDLDHSMATPQVLQIGSLSCAIDRLRISMWRPSLEWLFWPPRLVLVAIRSCAGTNPKARHARGPRNNLRADCSGS
jgi:hypothetical protein